MCKEHWSELRERIAERGLNSFVATSGEEAARRMVEGGFDPLMGAHNRILENCLRIGGLGVMFASDGGQDVCMLCRLIESCECGRGDQCPYKLFTTRAADEALERAKELGLLGAT